MVIKDHLLLLNWNRQTQPLLRQLALSSREEAASRGPASTKAKRSAPSTPGVLFPSSSFKKHWGMAACLVFPSICCCAFQRLVRVFGTQDVQG